MEEVLGDDPITGYEVCEVITALIENKSANKLMIYLSKHVSLLDVELGHLKRIRKVTDAEGNTRLCIILTTPGVFESFSDETKRMLEEDYQIIPSNTVVTQVPKFQPRSREVYDYCNALWPCSFHHSTSEDVLTITAEEEQLMTGYMMLAVDDAIEETRLQVHAGRVDLPINGDTCSWAGAVVIDPVTGECLARSSEVCSLVRPHSEDVNPSNAVSGGGASLAALEGGGQRRHPLRHASMRVIEAVAAAHRRRGLASQPPASGGAGNGVAVKNSGTDRVSSEAATIATTSNVKRKAKKCGGAAQGGRDDSEPTEPYLCTGFHVYLLKEPCSMCAMAIVHSRATRVVYGVVNETCGALGSRLLLHTVESLNHRFRVFRGVRAEECERQLLLHDQ